MAGVTTCPALTSSTTYVEQPNLGGRCWPTTLIVKMLRTMGRVPLWKFAVSLSSEIWKGLSLFHIKHCLLLLGPDSGHVFLPGLSRRASNSWAGLGVQFGAASKDVACRFAVQH